MKIFFCQQTGKVGLTKWDDNLLELDLAPGEYLKSSLFPSFYSDYKYFPQRLLKCEKNFIKSLEAYYINDAGILKCLNEELNFPSTCRYI